MDVGLLLVGQQEVMDTSGGYVRLTPTNLRACRVAVSLGVRAVLNLWVPMTLLSV
jgi:hypothetical protein